MEFDLSKIAQKALDNCLDNMLLKGKSIREWIVFIAENADDLVSRKSVLKIIEWAEYEHDPYYSIVDSVKETPSILPERKTGRWIPNRHTDTVLCSVCGKCYGDKYRYCPNCGAKMEEDEQ